VWCRADADGVAPPVGSAVVDLEIDLIAHAAVGTGPVVWYLAPGRAWREALPLVPVLLVV
jgi:hypothetical protein